MRTVARLLLAILVIAVCCSALYSADKPTTVILVRHAEKAGPSGDVDLSEAGKKRAECLTNALADAGVQTIFTTEFKRTQQTAAALAKKLSLTPVVTPGADVDGLVAGIQKHAGETVLVAGHSNTVPAVIKKLGGGDFTIKDDEYDRMFVVTLANGTASTVALRYCQ